MNHYKQSGVDIDKADALVDWIKQDESKVKNKLGQPVAGVGGFAALYQPNFSHMEQPLLVSSTDGVGTKLLLAMEKGNTQGLGQDLVAMCINDLYTIGARPLFFLDYYATGHLDSNNFKSVVKGIRDACAFCETSLIGGETAELPGLYEKGHFDLAGFVVGVVDKKKALGSEKVKDGDMIISLKSNGFHSNGYSLIRKWLKEKPNSYTPELLNPTKLYPIVADLTDSFPGSMHAASHITGGGLAQNLARVLPKGATATIALNQLPRHDWMNTFILNFVDSIQEVEPTFNLGTGMMLVVDPKDQEKIIETCSLAGYQVSVCGSVSLSDDKEEEAKVVYK